MTNTAKPARIVALNLTTGETIRLSASALGNMDSLKARVRGLVNAGYRVRVHDLSRGMVWETNKRSGLLLLKRFPLNGAEGDHFLSTIG